MVPYNISLSIIVVSGFGAASFGGTIPVSVELFGSIRIIAIVAPTDSANFEWILLNLDGNALAGSIGVVSGNTTSIENIPLVKGGAFNVTNASIDGEYRVQLIVDGSGIA